jgi:hypothetical protein
MALYSAAAYRPAGVVILVVYLLVLVSLPFALSWTVDFAEKRRRALKRARDQRLVPRMQARAAVKRADGSRGPRARRAVRVLARRARRDLGYIAWDALWHVWLAGPDDQVWRQLPEDLRNSAFSVAMDPATGQHTRMAVGAFCASRGLAPQDANQRTLFFVLTGQQAQHRTEDPDGRLLAAAYRAARDEQRAAVRQALAGADDLDLVRVVAGAGQDSVATITPDEASYLAGQLAGRRDWAGLWQLALSLPLAGAVTAVSSISDGWQPADHAGQGLLQQLATADAAQITLTITGGGPVADRPARTTGRSTHRPGGSARPRRPPPGWPHAVANLLRRPLALLTPADLDTVASLLLAWPSRPLELLAAYLDYRFGSEIALEAQVPLTPGSPDDVAIAPSPAPQRPAQA